MKKVELLAPAGSFESFLGAIHAGADAVYIGGQKYGARAYAENFTEEEVCLAIRYAHLFGKKLYMTVNTLVKEQEMQGLPAYIRPFYEEGLDGVIVQDMGVFALFRECFPGLELHGSTQMTVTGVRGAEFLLEQGASRIVPAREVSLEEIRRIKETGIEVEAFIHGAMCYSYSGQCLFSSMLGGRSGNRGRCAQPCRLPYRVLGSSEENYPLSLKDMCTLSFLPELIEAGIDSFKIEGRMKKPEYAAGVTALYRKYIDWYYENPSAEFRVAKEDMNRLRTLYIRSEIQEGYYHRHNGWEMITPDKPSYLGVDEKYLKEIRERYLDKAVKLPLRGEIFLETDKPVRLSLCCPNNSDNVCVTCCSQQNAAPAQKQPLSETDIRKQIGRMGNTPFALSELTVHMEPNLFVPVKQLNDLRRDALLQLENALLGMQKRKMPSLSEKRADAAEKAGYLEAETSDLPYVAVQLQSNAQLRTVLERKGIDRIYVDSDMCLTETKACLEAWKRESQGRKVFLVLPLILRLLDEAYLKQMRRELTQEHLWDGVLIRNLESLSFLKEIGWQGETAADANLYIWNRRAKEFFHALDILPTAPLECNKGEWHTLGLRHTEVIVYGRIPLMVTANCIRKTQQSCLKENAQKNGHWKEKANTDKEWLTLRDRYKTEFPVRCVCRHCYNEIYNSVPLSLHEYGKSIMGEKPTGVRIVLTMEKEAETAQVLDCYQDFTRKPDEKRQAAFSYTKGHYKRGAE